MKFHSFTLGLVFLLCVGVLAQEKPKTAALDPAMDINRSAASGLDWHDVTQWGIEGRILPEQERLRWFDRLPQSAQSLVTASVWSLSRDSAGMMVRFQTNSPSIHVHYNLLDKNLGMPHMPATGVSGIDLYARDNQGKWRWVQVAKPATQEVTAEIIKGLAPGSREYAAYLPLYNGVESLSIGVEQGSQFEGLAPRKKPIVFYGTSITHGACASRPGMVHTAILGRRFDRPVVNLGFSGNGRMDEAVGKYLVQVEAAAYVIDCLPNMQPADVAEKCIPLVKQLRAAQPQTPIVLVEDRRFTNDWILPVKQQFHTENHAALRSAYDRLQSEGIQNLFYIEGDHLYGDDSEGATDASHANDLGFMRQADIFEPVLREALAANVQLPAVAEAGSGALLQAEFIYPLEGRQTPECHASTIVETDTGLVAAWFGGTHENNPDVGIWVARHDGSTWSRPVEVVDGSEGESQEYACWNPVLFQPKSGPLLLFYKVGVSPSMWWGCLIRSEDGGATWSKPQRLGTSDRLFAENRNLLGPVKNKPIQLDDGSILCPSSTENEGWRVHFERTRDLGQTWEVIGPLQEGEKLDAIQPSILAYQDGRMQILCRTKQNVLGSSWSSDLGNTWGPMESTHLPNPNSGTDAVTLQNGMQLLVYNHTTRENKKNGRQILNVATSHDGHNWATVLTAENEGDADGYSYPAVIQTKDGLVHITYTWRRQTIKHLVLDPRKL